MKLYYSKGACSLAIRITIHELNLPCEYEAVNLKTKITATGANFFDINPKGAVPALITDDQQVLTENSAIQEYLAETHKATHLLPAVGNFQRYRVLEWLSFVSTELHKSFGPLFNPKVPETEKKEIFIPALKSKFAFADRALEKNHYISGDHFTIADSYFFVMLTWTPHFAIDLGEFVNITRYFKELKVRPSIVAAIAEE